MSVNAISGSRSSRDFIFHRRGLTISENQIRSIESTNNLNKGYMNGTFSDRRNRLFSIPRTLQRSATPDCECHHLNILKNIPSEIITKAKLLVNDAIKNKKIFTIFGPYDKVRKALRKRGWVEKVIDGKSICNTFSKTLKFPTKCDTVPNVGGDTPLVQSLINSDSNEKNAENEDIIHAVASQFVFNCTADLIWSLRMNQIDMRQMKGNQIINHYRKAGSFTTKSGLIKSFNHICWFEKDSDEIYPRSYIISEEDDRKAFLNDYQFTACLSLIKLTSTIKDLITESPEKEIIHGFDSQFSGTNNSRSNLKKLKPIINYQAKEIGEINLKIDRKFPEMAIHYCQLYLKFFQKKDIDQKEIVFCSSKKWEDFFKNFELVTSEGYGIECTENMRNICNFLCNEFQKIHSQYHLDGVKNIWIVKPGAKSRGRGIYCLSNYSDLSNIVNCIHDTVIIQKYIERPLLIYNTKFDIRQWFMVTSWSPLTIWWYKDSYVRFCSQQFTLNDFNESVHLSNNSIQHKYHNGPRSDKLPTNNMWHWSQFEVYLKSKGYEDIWRKKILPSMKNTVIDILLCAQEEIEDRKNSFELYGADFMITENDFRTWLLEINSSPCMAPSTDITAKLTKSVTEDLLKVLLDYPNDVYCDTGSFELLFKQSPFTNPIIELSNDFAIYGNKIKRPKLYQSNREINETAVRSQIIIDDSSILRNKLKRIIDKCATYQSDGEHTSINHRRSKTIVPSSSRYPNDKQNQNLEIPYQISELNNRRTKSHAQSVSLRLNSSDSLIGGHKLISHTRSDNSKSEEKKYEKVLPILKSLTDKLHDESQSSSMQQRYKEYKYKTLVKRSTEENKALISKLNTMNSGVEYKKEKLNQILKAYLPKYQSK